MKKILFLYILFYSFVIVSAQETKKYYLADSQSKNPIAFYPIKLAENEVIYTDLNGLFECFPNTILEFNNESFESIKINSNAIKDTLFIKQNTTILEELIINKSSEKIYINPFYKKRFSSKSNLVETFPIGIKHELLSKISFNKKYYNNSIKNISFRITNELKDFKNVNSYVRLNIYDSNKKNIYISKPILIDPIKHNEVNHAVESNIYIDETDMYFGIEIIGLTDKSGKYINTTEYYTRVSQFNTDNNDYNSENFIHSINNPKHYKLTSINNYPHLKVFGFTLQ